MVRENRQSDILLADLVLTTFLLHLFNVGTSPSRMGNFRGFCWSEMMIVTLLASVLTYLVLLNKDAKRVNKTDRVTTWMRGQQGCYLIDL